jgi:ligand-binding SRPBCC domain-containing protein
MTMLRETAMSAIHREQWLPASLPAVFSFFSDAGNLDRITPPWLRFNVLGRTNPQLSAGTLNSQEWWINKVAVSSGDHGKSVG